MKLSEIRLHLVDTNKEVCDAFEEIFGAYPHVSVHNQPFQTLSEFDLMVSPANSYGQMDGGIDKYITEFFGQQLMDRVQQHILSHYAGEQPVGTSFIIETNHEKHPFLAHTPTMRVPQSILGTDNPYRAMKAMLLAVQQHNEMQERKITSIACSGLGTLIGKVPPLNAVRQMELAYRHMLNPLTTINWNIAMDREKEIYSVATEIPNKETNFQLHKQHLFNVVTGLQAFYETGMHDERAINMLKERAKVKIDTLFELIDLMDGRG